jgi:hypothetical protein
MTKKFAGIFSLENKDCISDEQAPATVAASA